LYKPGGTIAEALGRIQTKSYVLPAIQREFVWKPEQIERLFDGLMQGYPPDLQKAAVDLVVRQAETIAADWG
jgi:hypothetical protein